MDEIGKFWLGFLIGAIFCIAVFVGIATISNRTYADGIKFGQIQALTGNIKYHLVINPDSTKTWEEIK